MSLVRVFALLAFVAALWFAAMAVVAEVLF